MRLLLLFAAVAAVYCTNDPKHSPPKVALYSRDPGEYGMPNVLICHVSGFHPPDITIQLMKGEEEIKNANQTDLAFKADWRFHLTKTAAFTPASGDKYSCKVTHGGVPNVYAWVPNM